MKLRSGRIIDTTAKIPEKINSNKQNDINSKREIFTFSIIFTSILLLGSIFEFESVFTDFFKNHKFSLFSDV
jgi:hypothetical protein